MTENLSLSSTLNNPSIETDSYGDSLNLVKDIVTAASDRKGENIIIIKAQEVSYLADYFVIVSGFSPVQVRAIANSIKQTVQDNWQVNPYGMEGQQEASWVLIDYGDVIVHVLQPKQRQFYNLEAFWGHAEKIDVN
ncbi:MAG: ribosome silencing factor, partial [Microcoleaceae cyanobacterium]